MFRLKPPVYKMLEPEGDPHCMHITSATKVIRPYAVAAILKNVIFTQSAYNSFIDLQVLL